MQIEEHKEAKMFQNFLKERRDTLIILWFTTTIIYILIILFFLLVMQLRAVDHENTHIPYAPFTI